MPLASDCFVGAKITGGDDFANGFLPTPVIALSSAGFRAFPRLRRESLRSVDFFQNRYLQSARFCL
jgi:hypothetical protein